METLEIILLVIAIIECLGVIITGYYKWKKHVQNEAIQFNEVKSRRGSVSNSGDI